MLKTLFGEKLEKTRIFPVSTKIIFIFTIFILISNFSSHYISLMMNRNELVKLLKQILVKDLKELYTFANTQYELFQYNQDQSASLANLEKKALNDFKNRKSVFLGIKTDGQFLFQISRDKKSSAFNDIQALNLLNRQFEREIQEGFISFKLNGEEYLGVYKFNAKWNAFLLRGEEYGDFYRESNKIFERIAVLILMITIATSILGIFVLRHILRFLRRMTHAILKMNETQQLEMINMKGAPNDDIAFLGYAFNALSNTINNLLNIFRKFTNKDIVIKAYKEKEIRLEGSRKDLTCLFSDIKSFTTMTEVLGTDIIKLLNLHYNKAIQEIIDHDGIIGSIIGDALLAVYGALPESSVNKSYQAIVSAYRIQEVAASLREKMEQKKQNLLSQGKVLDELEEKVYRAVLIQVGVGIDGGSVFYGNIGSTERMTNTVIGDNVNSASRLEGLTRIYQVPVICSEYVKDDVEQNVPDSGIRFIELDLVQVKGKTIGKKVFWPVLNQEYLEIQNHLESFSKGLKYYYEGQWEKASPLFEQCPLEPARVFEERTRNHKAPEGWNGIWAMTSK